MKTSAAAASVILAATQIVPARPRRDNGGVAVPSHLERVTALFPERIFMVSRLAVCDAAFRTLCEEYDLAVGALEVLDAQPNHTTSDMVRIAEYRALVEELKDDLQNLLSAHRNAAND